MIVDSNALEIILTNELFLLFMKFGHFFHEVGCIGFFMEELFFQCVKLWQSYDSILFFDNISENKLYFFIVARILLIDLMTCVDLAWLTNIKQTDFLQKDFKIRLLNLGLFIDVLIDVFLKA